MSDMLNEKFEEFIAEAGDPMPSVGAAVVPGSPVASGYMNPVTGQTSTAVNAKAGGRDPMPTVPPSVVPGQSVEDNGGSTFEKPQGEDNPGEKAAKHNKKVDDGHVTRDKHQDPAPSVKSSGYEIPGGPNNTKVFGMEEIDYSSEEDINALVEGEVISETFKDKAKTIFEAAVKAKITEQVSSLQEQYAAKLAEEVEAIKTSLSEKVDETLNYAIQNWLEENVVAIDSGLKLEIAENFMKGLKTVFEENYLEIPDDKVDVVESMNQELCEMEQRLNEQVERNIELNNRISGHTKTIITREMSEGLADTQKEKLASLAEGVEFVSEESFRGQLKTIKESYFPSAVAPKAEVTDETPVAAEGAEVSDSMRAYMDAIARWSK
jgi:hypothetical protein